MTVMQQHHCGCDSLAANRDLLDVEQAREIAVGLAAPVNRTELVPLSRASGRIASRDMFAPLAMPFFDNSAMDGYAVSAGCLKGKGPWRLKVAGTIAAGDQFNSEDPNCEPKHAVRIFTGAPVPTGFDAVIAQENTHAADGWIDIQIAPRTGENIRYAGSDAKRGAILVGAGTKIGSHHIGLLAANGYCSLNVNKRPHVAVFSTGDELAKPGEKAKPGQVYDCNKPMLIALLAEMGIAAEDLGVLPDDLITTQELLESCRDHFDLVISSGSVSVGGRDFLKPALVAAGGSIKNWKVAVKPGKPVMFGKLGDTIYTGLPGNPFAAFVGFELFIIPQILRLCGAQQQDSFALSAIADFSWHRKPGRTEIFPVKSQAFSANGLPKLSRLGNSVSATLYPLANASGLGMVPANCTEIRPGDMIKWQPFCT